MINTKKESKKVFDLDYCLKSVKTFTNLKDDLIYLFRNGRKKGTKTYVRDIDEIDVNGYKNKMWSWKEGELNLWTGYMNQGKSQFLIYLCLLKALHEDWKFAFFSPENSPPIEFFDDLIHTMLGKTTDRHTKGFDVTEKEYLEAYQRIEKNFFFIYPENDQGMPDYTIENIEKIFEYLVFEEGVKAVVIDPYVKVKHNLNGLQEHQYVANFMMERVHFARKYLVSYHVVLHQLTPRIDKNTGNYLAPDVYGIKGGGSFADSADNVLSVWRPNYSTDPSDTTVIIKSGKIKKQKLVGFPNAITMNFDRKKNRYISPDGYDYMDGSVKPKQEPQMYNPDRFHSSGVKDFDITPF